MHGLREGLSSHVELMTELLATMCLVLFLRCPKRCLAAESLKITCDAGQFPVGKPATVTCHLHEIATKSSVTVVHYFRKGEKTDERDALMCIKDGKLVCVVKTGYHFQFQPSDNISDVISIVIPEVTSEFAGYYGCNTISDADIEVHKCRLAVTNTTSGNITTSDPGTDAKESCKPDVSSQCFAAVASLGAVFFSLILVLVVIMVVFKIRKNEIRKIQRGQPAENSIPLQIGYEP